MYAGPLENGDVAAVIINWKGSQRGTFEFKLSDIGINNPVIARDLWKHEDIGEFTGTFKVDSIPAFGSYALRFRKANDQIVFLH